MTGFTGSNAARPARRWDLLAFGIVLLGPLAIVLGMAISRHQVDDLERALIQDVHRLLEAPKLRRSHVEHPSPGTFGELLAPHLPALAAADAGPLAARPQLQPFVEGKQPVRDMPPALAAEVDRIKPLVNEVLRTSRAEAAGPPEALNAVCGWSAKPVWHFALVGRVAAIEAWQLIDGDRPDDAVDICMDGFGLGRDLGIATAVLGRMFGATIHDDLTRACGVALDRASASRKKRAFSQLLAIRDAVPSFSTTMQEEFVTFEVGTLGMTLDDWAFAGLPASAQQTARDGAAELKFSRFMRFATRDAWRDIAEAWGELAGAMALPAAEREVVVERVGVRLKRRRVNPIAAISVPIFSSHADRHRADLSFLTALAVGVGADLWRGEHGEWPPSIRAPEPQPEGWERAGELASVPTFDPDGADLVVRVRFADPSGAKGGPPAVREFRFTPDARP